MVPSFIYRFLHNKYLTSEVHVHGTALSCEAVANRTISTPAHHAAAVRRPAHAVHTRPPAATRLGRSILYLVLQVL